MRADCPVCVTHRLETDSGGDSVQHPVRVWKVGEAAGLNALEVQGLNREKQIVVMLWW